MSRTVAGSTALPVPYRVLIEGYGVAVYLVFLAVFVYFIGFSAGNQLPAVLAAGFPRTVDSGGPMSFWAMALTINFGLVLLFAGQHSVMARQTTKRALASILPPATERSTYVLLSSICLAALMFFWHPIPSYVWQMQAPWAQLAMNVGSLCGWLLVLASTFMISHADLFGLRQVLAAARQRKMPKPKMVTPLVYKLVRHPLYLGFLLAFWLSPAMTWGHLFFAAAGTGYIFVGIHFEEKDLAREFSGEYLEYRRRIPMLLPIRSGRRQRIARR